MVWWKVLQVKLEPSRVSAWSAQACWNLQNIKGKAKAAAATMASKKSLMAHTEFMEEESSCADRFQGYWNC